MTEPKIHLVDRVLRLGDFCKRAHDDVRSGVVLDARVRARLAHVISGEEVQGWKTMDDVEERTCLELGDYVAYDDWVGQVGLRNCVLRRRSDVWSLGVRGWSLCLLNELK